MRAVLTNFGTTGDIQPFLALAAEFRRAGHLPVLALSPNFGPRVKDLGMKFVPVGPDVRQQQTAIITTLLERPNTFETLEASLAPLASALPQVFVDLRAACRDADVLISGAVQPAARIVHEVSGIPFVSVQVAHFGGGGRPALQQAAASLINPFRAQVGLPPLCNPISNDANSQQLSLYAISRHVFKPPADFPSHYHVTGYFFLDEKDWQPEASLQAFLSAGEAPVVITFGSTAYENADALSDIAIDAIQRTGCRAIIQHGWGGLALGRKLPPEIHAAGYVPHDWLFPRAACIVHHGGVGTAASTFRSGIPGVFITHGSPLHAKLAQELGCAGPPVPYWELTSERLAKAISATLATSEYYRAAAVLREKIRFEQGVRKARQLIEQLVQRMPSRP